ncbi:LysE family translocator [Kineococcus rhizosphaerae]|uniref:Threonine/homoserine/homoserine lactone efflux protein n=1 Tax=Kineococcus rhizosphaerae TaxID=559628 RepID=A0A2T0R3M8_9ACTN|nr:LysE family translocator [Kineococcus rhizosphaerae]PRY14667.1 threonine/homoserine/homoserine lactone efflux protein [Kineococcus rhizosphaerae]
MTLDAVLAFCALCLLLELTPGPNTFLVLRHSLQGARTGVVTALGSAVGAVVWAAAVAVGLAALLERSAQAYQVLKVAGGLYLVHLGVRTLLAHRGPASTPAGSASSLPAAFRAGLVSCVLNPKVGLFFVAVVPQFVPAGAGVGTTLLLGVLEAGVALTYLSVLSQVAARAVEWLRRPRVTRTLERASAAVLTAFGVGTLVSAR